MAGDKETERQTCGRKAIPGADASWLYRGNSGSPTCSREDAAVRSGNRTRGQRALRVRSPKVSGGEGTQTDC